MPYNIIKTDGTLLLELADGFIDSSSASITFIGKNVSKFGEIQNKNSLHMLENFASTTTPNGPLTGQLWYDKNVNSLKVYSYNKWQPIAVISTSQSEAAQVGNLWFDATNKQLSVNNGSGFSLIGPETVAGYGITRLVSSKLMDISSIYHPIIKCIIDNEVVSIISNSEFDINSSNAITGYSHIYKGINFYNATSFSTQLNGWSRYADSSNKLKNNLGSFVSADPTNTVNSVVQRDGSGNIAVSDINLSTITANTGSGNLSGTWTVVGSLLPSVTATYNMGSSSLKWNNVYASAVNAATVNSTIVNFTSLTDSNSASITKFDVDTALAANSDSRIPTQRAIKAYIDAAVQTEVAARIAADNLLNSAINGLVTVPVASVFYVASSTVPTGFLECNGATLFKNTYPNLAAALDGVTASTDTTFNLPDLRGEFIRGWDHGRGIDSGRNLGSSQDQAFASHTHSYVNPKLPNQFLTGAYQNGPNVNWRAENITADVTGAAGGTETRPRNVALMPIIKY